MVKNELSKLVEIKNGEINTLKDRLSSQEADSEQLQDKLRDIEQKS